VRFSVILGLSLPFPPSLATCKFHLKVYKLSSVSSKQTSVPNPNVFGPPGCGSFYHQAKIVRKTLIPTVFDFFWAFLSLKNDVNVP
jgi:hypothetical protein